MNFIYGSAAIVSAAALCAIASKLDKIFICLESIVKELSPVSGWYAASIVEADEQALEREE